MNQNIKTALIIGGAVLAIFIIVPSIMGTVSGWQGTGWGMMGPGMTGMMGGFGTMGWMSIFWIVVLGLVVWGVVALVRGLSPSGGANSSPNQPDSALEMLKKRYARGEINKEEYEEKKKDLE